MTGASAPVLTDEIARPSTPDSARVSNSAIWASASAPTGPTICASTPKSAAAISTPFFMKGAKPLDTSW